MYIRALGLLLFLTRVLLAQEPTPILPDANMTPSDTFDVTAQDICTRGYARKVRDVPAEMKREVYREYGIISHGPGGGIGKLFRLGKLPVNTQLAAYCNVVTPHQGGADWQLRFQVQFRFPK